MSLVLRSIKGSALTHEEMDNNFKSMVTKLLEKEKFEVILIGNFEDYFDVTEYFIGAYNRLIGTLVQSDLTGIGVFDYIVLTDSCHPIFSESESLQGSQTPVIVNHTDGKKYLKFSGNASKEIKVAFTVYSITSFDYGTSDVVPIKTLP